jgi:hypothetical protein
MRRLVLAIVLASVAPAAAAVDDPAPQTERKVEPPSQGRPSGFWGSTRPATNGAYRYRLLAIGVVLAAATGYLMLRLVRRANAEREARNARSR